MKKTVQLAAVFFAVSLTCAIRANAQVAGWQFRRIPTEASPG
jgi:hypothetical protein